MTTSRDWLGGAVVSAAPLAVVIGARSAPGLPGTLIGALGLGVALTVLCTALSTTAGADRLQMLLTSPVGIALAAFTACYLLSAVGGQLLSTNLGVTIEVLTGVLTLLTVAWWADRLERVRILVVLFAAGSLGATVPALFQARDVSVAARGSIVVNRPSGSFVDPNELGVYSALTIIVAMLLVGIATTNVQRALGVVVLASAAGGLVLSFSRGSWVGCTVGIIVLLVVPGLRQVVLVLVPAAVASVASAWFVGFPVPVAAAVARLDSLFSGTANPYDFRPVIWSEAWRLGWERPLLGWGPGSFRQLSADDSSPLWGWPARHAHNGFLNTFVENGLLTVSLLLVVACLLVAALVGGGRRFGRGSAEARLRAGAMAVLAVIAMHLLIDYALRNIVVLLTVCFWVGLVWAIGRLPGRPDAAPAAPAQPRTTAVAGGVR